MNTTAAHSVIPLFDFPLPSLALTQTLFPLLSRGKNCLSVYMAGCFQMVFEGKIVAVLAVHWLERSAGHKFF